MSVATIPDRTIQEREAALAWANEIRTRRKNLKIALRNGHMTPATVLGPLRFEDWLQTMRIEKVLLATPKLGKTKVNRALVACRISPSKTIGGMTKRQREELLAFLAENVPCAEIGEAA